MRRLTSTAPCLCQLFIFDCGGRTDAPGSPGLGRVYEAHYEQVPDLIIFWDSGEHIQQSILFLAKRLPQREQARGLLA